MGVIGDTLSAARTRQAVDLEEVEAATGIRTRYLRAIEEEDWGALPEEFYVRAFTRRYAQFLDLDPDPLIDELRRQRGGPRRGEAPTSPFATTTSRRAEALRRRRKRQSAYGWIGAAAVAVAIVVVFVLIVSGGNDDGGGKGGSGNRKGASTGAASGASGAKGSAKEKRPAQKGAARGPGAAGNARAKGARAATVLVIEPTAEVWACVLDAEGKPLVDGVVLAAGETMGPFHSRSYTAAFGNGQVAMTVDGKAARISPSSSPIGFTVRGGRVRRLPEGRRPGCE